MDVAIDKSGHQGLKISLITAPPASFPNNADVAASTGEAGTNTDELSSADDEDWVLQKTLERKRSSTSIVSHRKKDSVSFPIIFF